jgi:hypothetical protein
MKITRFNRKRDLVIVVCRTASVASSGFRWRADGRGSQSRSDGNTGAVRGSEAARGAARAGLRPRPMSGGCAGGSSAWALGC